MFNYQYPVPILISDMTKFEITFEIRKQKLKLKDVINLLWNYYAIIININYYTNATTY